MKKLLYIFLFLCFCNSAFATTYYVKDDGNDSLAGTSDATAWKTIAKVNSFTFATGDDVYFKCGDTWTNQKLTVDWEGASDDRVIIGAYYGAGTIGVSGDKPIIDGTYTTPTQYEALVYVDTQDYVTVTNLNLVNSTGRHLVFENSDYGYATSVDANYSYATSMVWIGSDYGKAESCTVTRNGVNQQLTGSGTWGTCIGFANSEHGTATKNKIYETYGEGIDFYNGSHYGTAEYNLLYDVRAVGLYADGSGYCTFKYNMVYGTTNTTWHRTGVYPGNAFYITDEIADSDYATTTTIYGNFVAHCAIGVRVGSDAVFTNTNIYNNTFAYCGIGFSIASNTYTTSSIKNNIILGGVLYDGPSTTSGLTWDYNNWSSSVIAGVTGANDVVEDPKLYKATGWNTITAGSLSVLDFSLLSTSPCIDAGINLGASYDDGLDLNNTTLPDTVSLILQGDYGTGWDIGPIYTGGAVITDPTGLLQTGYSTEADLRLTGGTLTITLTDATWDATIGADNYLTTSLIAALSGNGVTATSWNTVVRDVLTYAEVTRSLDSVVTITIAAAPTYDIVTTETISLTIPASCTNAGTTIATNSFYISVVQPNVISQGINLGGNISYLYSSDGKQILKQ